jgi:N,N'-diacetyllegionaminate synthase
MSDKNKVIIIAEAGVNHNGDISLAKTLIDEAATSGVDYIKFQTFVTELIVDKSAPKAAYQDRAIGQSTSQFDMIKALELSFEDFVELKQYCDIKGVKFLTTAADLVSLEKIRGLGVDYIKISSGELTNPLFLRAVAKIGKPVILSTGMSNLSEVERALNVLLSYSIERENVTLLHCNTDYPTAMQDVNLKAMLTLQRAFNVPVGYSDHTLGIEIPIAAVAMGATVIEKHFTLDKTMTGPDHQSSLEPNELRAMVKAIRNIELAMGDGIKRPSLSEQKNIVVVRKSVFASQAIRKGEAFSNDNLAVKRPGDGIPADTVEGLFGKLAGRDINQGEKLDYQAIQW